MKTYIIAESACAHQGRIGICTQMIDLALLARVDCIKFQIFQPYLIPNITSQEVKYLEKCQLSEKQFGYLRDYCGDQIDFMLTPFDLPSIAAADRIGPCAIKVPSGRVTDREYMDAVIATGRKVIISTGMLDYEEVRRLKQKYHKVIKDVKWLHCVSSYPTDIKDLNLNVLRGSMFDGLSDHTISTIVPAVAVGIGASIIEKHFTLRRTLPGPDMKVSLEPLELIEMVNNIRDVEKMLGSKHKSIQESEKAMIYRKVDTWDHLKKEKQIERK